MRRILFSLTFFALFFFVYNYFFSSTAFAIPNPPTGLTSEALCTGTDDEISEVRFTWTNLSSNYKYRILYTGLTQEYIETNNNFYSVNVDSFPVGATIQWSLSQCDRDPGWDHGCSDQTAGYTPGPSVTRPDCDGSEPPSDPAPPPSNRTDCEHRSAACSDDDYPYCIDTAWDNTFIPNCGGPANNGCSMENKGGEESNWTRSCAVAVQSTLPEAGPIIGCDAEDDNSCPFGRTCVDPDGDGKFGCEFADIKECTDENASQKCLSGKCKDGKCDNSLIALVCEPVGLNPTGGEYKTEDFNNNTKFSCKTAIGTFNADTQTFTKSILRLLLSISGGILLILIIINGYKLMTSQGDPEKIKDAREGIIAAIAGILLIIFAITILQIITVDIIGIPGFGR